MATLQRAAVVILIVLLYVLDVVRADLDTTLIYSLCNRNSYNPGDDFGSVCNTALDNVCTDTQRYGYDFYTTSTHLGHPDLTAIDPSCNEQSYKMNNDFSHNLDAAFHDDRSSFSSNSTVEWGASGACVFVLRDSRNEMTASRSFPAMKVASVSEFSPRLA
ncbi:hypothetical protein NL676_023357 [Syzygium grande]|nr:hypothetical protein NL676_023357 [Syzygium grande]